MNRIIKGKDNYQIINKIGQGSYGKVFRAKDKNTQEIVAIKTVSVKSNNREEV